MPGGRPEKGSSGQHAAARNYPRRADVIIDRLEQLAAISDEPDCLTRLYLDPAHKRSVEQVMAWMRGAGMTVRMDAVGSVIGRYEGEIKDRPALLIGSHIDTVRNAGKFDGNLGVLAAIDVVDRLNAMNRRLPFAIEVVAFGDEEGVRYPSTLTGSRALADRFDPKVLDELDDRGITRRQALEAFGCDPTAIGREARDPANVLGYIEIHIEQGPVLEAENLPVGVVTAISGASRGTITVTGSGGHAGTVPMSIRNDAMAAAAEMVLLVERLAKNDPDLVATVGQCEVANGAVNVVPANVTFSIDVRSPKDQVRLEALNQMRTDFAGIAERRGVAVQIQLKYEAPSAACDPSLINALARSVERSGFPVRKLPSGAGHDGMAFKDRFPFAMLFVKSRGGISHHPDEFTSNADIEVAAEVLADCVEGYLTSTTR
jgi:allantoate deiminase